MRSLRAQQTSAGTQIVCTIWLLLRARLNELWTWDIECRGFFYEAPLDFGLHLFSLAHLGIPCFAFPFLFFFFFFFLKEMGKGSVCGGGGLKISTSCPTCSAPQTAKSQPCAFDAQNCSYHLKRQFFCIHSKLHLSALLLMYF